MWVINMTPKELTKLREALIRQYGEYDSSFHLQKPLEYVIEIIGFILSDNIKTKKTDLQGNLTVSARNIYNYLDNRGYPLSLKIISHQLNLITDCFEAKINNDVQYVSWRIVSERTTRKRYRQVTFTPLFIDLKLSNSALHRIVKEYDQYNGKNRTLKEILELDLGGFYKTQNHDMECDCSTCSRKALLQSGFAAKLEEFEYKLNPILIQLHGLQEDVRNLGLVKQNEALTKKLKDYIDNQIKNFYTDHFAPYERRVQEFENKILEVKDTLKGILKSGINLVKKPEKKSVFEELGIEVVETKN